MQMNTRDECYNEAIRPAINRINRWANTKWVPGHEQVNGMNSTLTVSRCLFNLKVFSLIGLLAAGQRTLRVTPGPSFSFIPAVNESITTPESSKSSHSLHGTHPKCAKKKKIVSKIHWRPIGKIRQKNFIQIGRTGDRWLTDDEKKGVVSRSASCLTVLLPAHALPALMQPILITTTSQSTPARARSRSIFTRQNLCPLPVRSHSFA